MDKKRRLERLAIASLTEEACPGVEQLAAYALGLLTGTEQLSVATHVRECPICTHDVALCRPPAPRPRTIFARLIPLPLAEGLQRGAGRAYIRQYMAADLLIELTVAPPIGDYWRITGQVLRAGEGLADRLVTMRERRRSYEQASDALGFFTFESVPAGRYTLSVADGQVQVQIRDLVLSLEDS